MSALILSAFDAVAKFLKTRQRLSAFSCGDCDRWRSCGLPPDVLCEYKATQVARGDWLERRRVARLASTLPHGGG